MVGSLMCVVLLYDLEVRLLFPDPLHRNDLSLKVGSTTGKNVH